MGLRSTLLTEAVCTQMNIDRRGEETLPKRIQQNTIPYTTLKRMNDDIIHQNIRCLHYILCLYIWSVPQEDE